MILLLDLATLHVHKTMQINVHREVLGLGLGLEEWVMGRFWRHLLTAHHGDPLGMSLFFWRKFILLHLYWFLTRLRDAWLIGVNNLPFLTGLSRKWWQKVCLVDTICDVKFFSKFCIQMKSGWWEQWMKEVYEFLANFDGLSFLANFEGLNVFCRMRLYSTMCCEMTGTTIPRWQHRFPSAQRS